MGRNYVCFYKKTIDFTVDQPLSNYFAGRSVALLKQCFY